MNDLISRQAAIKAIEDLKDCYNGFSDTYDKACIIGVLEEVPSAQPEYSTDEWCTDCKEYDHERKCCPRFNRVIRTTLQEAQRTGRWIKHEVKLFNGCHTGRYFDECSECGKLTTEWRKVTEYHRWNFCPHCGARMEESE